ncbi:hypothetical protein L3X38_022428 [Prunus dulcis]|uniref:DUF4220 domain-containing protein n=1 Tax=Prunus dulcis TaxID=3755 RepID=A0AAD4VXL0_PRUDU|nr:hypothetical protein L3X38_022428 [Prunus dulcis]
MGEVQAITMRIFWHFGLQFSCYTITAFALEDNTLWLRHFLRLIFQVIAAMHNVFIQSFPTNKTILLFLGGTIKYAERTLGLYLASLDNFKESML